jgi:hypothetical protein
VEAGPGALGRLLEVVHQGLGGFRAKVGSLNEFLGLLGDYVGRHDNLPVGSACVLGKLRASTEPGNVCHRHENGRHPVALHDSRWSGRCAWPVEPDYMALLKEWAEAATRHAEVRRVLAQVGLSYCHGRQPDSHSAAT